MGITKTGLFWSGTKCLVKNELYLNRLKYTMKSIEDYENHSIDKDIIENIRNNILDKYKDDNFYTPQLSYYKYSDIQKIKDDTYKEILKIREQISTLNLQIPLASNKEILERLEEERNWLQARTGDLYDEEHDDENLEYDMEVFSYLLHVFEFLEEQEDIKKGNMILTIETG